MPGQSSAPPVIILGGGANALSIARSLGGAGIPVYAINAPSEPVRYSRFCRWIPTSETGLTEEAWTDYLLGPRSEQFRGSVLLAASDASLMVLARNREQLRDRFVLDLSNPQAQLAMLDKLETYRHARAAGVATPRFWTIRHPEEVLACEDELVFPLLIKPLLSHVFAQHFGRKFLTADSLDELLAGMRRLEGTGLEVMLVETIPGPDDLLCSYYTYLDESGTPLFDYTKRVVRRNPPVRGGGCYHVSDHIPELREPALRLFRQAGLRGLANVEFKRDPRDGELKLIECNARFTAANRLVAASGYDLARFVYNRLVGRPQEPLGPLQTGRTLWYPVEDVKSFLALRREGQLTLAGWLRSLSLRFLLPCFSLTDPLPGMAQTFREIVSASRKLAEYAQPRPHASIGTDSPCGADNSEPPQPESHEPTVTVPSLAEVAH